MVDIIIIDLSQTYGINQLFIEHSRVDKTIQKRLNFFFVAQGSVHFVWFLLKGSHLLFYGLKVTFEIVENVFQLLHDAISDGELLAEGLELLADFDVVVGGVFLYFFQLSDNGIAHVS